MLGEIDFGLNKCAPHQQRERGTKLSGRRALLPVSTRRTNKIISEVGLLIDRAAVENCLRTLRLPRQTSSGIRRVRLLNTVAGPCRIRTGFLVMPLRAPQNLVLIDQAVSVYEYKPNRRISKRRYREVWPPYGIAIYFERMSSVSDKDPKQMSNKLRDLLGRCGTTRGVH
jgi:hypothetical protein